MFVQPLVFTGCSTIQFFNSPPTSPNTVCEAAGRSLPLTVQLLCDLRDAMSFHWSLSASHPNHCPGKQRVFLGMANILTMCLCSPEGVTQ